MIRSPLVRFGLVAVAGLAIDLAVGWCLASLAGVPLPLAAMFGFAAGAGFNYLLHERWTFGRGAVSARRGALYALSLLATLGTRVGTVAAIEAAVPALPALAVLVLSTGVSFAVNFLVSRHLVFPSRSRGGTVPR